MTWLSMGTIKDSKRLSSTFRIPDDDLVEMEAALMETSLKATQKIEQYIEATKYVPEGADAVEVASTTRVRERRGRLCPEIAITHFRAGGAG